MRFSVWVCRVIALMIIITPVASMAQENGGGIAQPARDDITPKEAAHSLGLDKQPLLPVRPRDFDPTTMPPPSMPSDEGGYIPHSDVPAMYMAQLGSYIAQLTYCMRWLVWVTSAGVLFFIVHLFYLRSRLKVADQSLEIAKVSLQLMQRNGTLAKEASEKKSRAYVFIHGVTGEMTGQGIYRVRAEIKNFGVTPAYEVTFGMTVFVEDIAYGKNIDPQPQVLRQMQEIVPPGGSYFFTAQTLEPVSHESKAVHSSDRAIYAFGEVRYKDVFGAEHSAQAMMRCTGEAGLGSGIFEPCAGDELS